MALKPTFQDQKVGNNSLPSKSCKTTKYPSNQNYNCKTILVKELIAFSFCLEPSHFDQRLNFDQLLEIRAGEK
jgi:hypothetical protein